MTTVVGNPVAPRVDPGDPSDFDAFFRAHYRRLVSALSVASDPEAAADAVQEAFVQANLRWRRVSTLDNPAAWVRRVAVNRLIDQHRRRTRGAEMLTRPDVPAPRELQGTDFDLAAAVAALPERQRLAVCLHYLLDLPVAEVASLLGVSPGTVKSNLHDARASLHQRLEVHDD